MPGADRNEARRDVKGFVGSLRDLGFVGLGGVSGRVEVVVAGVVDAMIFGHDREETLARLARSRS
jgi:hypothetical protein